LTPAVKISCERATTTMRACFVHQTVGF
jgi:hypothetical protein